MAGRGRGRSRGGLSFSTDALNIQRGEIISTPGQQPPPLFAPLQCKPIPLPENAQTQNNLMEIKQMIQVKFRESPYFLKLEEKKHDIERYSDKYQLNLQESVKKWTPDWKMFPAELKPKRKRIAGTLRSKRQAVKKSGTVEDVLSKLENLEKNIPTESTDKEEKEEDEEKEEEEQDADEEEESIDDEEETDYNLTYFDNGEGYGDDDDEDDEPTYS